MRHWLRLAATSATVFIIPLLANDTPISNAGQAKLYSDSTSALYAQETLDSLNCIKHTFRIKYAPKEWKYQLTGWDLNDQIELAKSKVQNADSITLHDARQILLQFMNSCNDYHVKTRFHSTAFSYLPFRVKSSEGRYFVSWIDKMLLCDRGLELRIGDELLTFNDRPVGDVVNELYLEYFNHGLPSTDHALAEISLTLRMAYDGQIPQQGDVPLEIKRRDKVLKGELEWICGSEDIADPFQGHHKAAGPHRDNQLKGLSHAVFHKPMKTPHHQSFVDVSQQINRLKANDHDIIDDDFSPLGSFESYVPTLGKVIWKSSRSTTFNAYIFEHPRTKKSIGYVRIPSYDVDGEFSAREFAYIIKELEKSTEALVIDQVCNPGGDLFLAYTIASMLSTTPLGVPSHAFTITQKDVSEALNYLDIISYIDDDYTAREIFEETISGYIVDMDLVEGAKNHFQFIVDQWNAGHHITDQHHLFGIAEIKPYPYAAYSKPILMLIDSLDFSCGDILPAILQDNQRATLFGTRTSGAGGYVETYSFPNILGMTMFSCTASFALRPGDFPIENLGVTPDINYEITPFDLQNNYSGYSKAVNKALESLIYPKPLQRPINR